MAPMRDQVFAQRPPSVLMPLQGRRDIFCRDQFRADEQVAQSSLRIDCVLPTVFSLLVILAESPAFWACGKWIS